MLKLPFGERKNSSSNKFLVVDISSDGVKVLTFYAEDDILKIVSATEGKLQNGSVRAGVIINKDDVDECLSSALEKTEEEIDQNIRRAIFSVGDDNFIGLTTTVRATRGTSSPIGEQEIKEINSKITEASIFQAQNEYFQSTGNADTDLEVIASAKVYTKVDNKKVSSLANEVGQTIEIASFKAFSPTFHIKNIRHIAKKAGLDIIAIVPKAYALSQNLKYSTLENNDFVLLNIGSDTTDVAVVFGKGIVATKTLNIGYYHLVEGISEKMGLAMREAEKVLDSYKGGLLTSSEEKIVQKCTMEVLNIWIKGVDILFGEFTGVKTFSPVIYVTGIGVSVPETLTYLREKPWAKSVPFKDNPQIRKLEFSDFPKIVDSTGSVKSHGWLPVVSLGIVYLEIENK